MSRGVRAIPSAVFCAPWFNPITFGAAANSERSLPRSVYEGLSERGQQVAAGLAAPGEEVVRKWAPDWRISVFGRAERIPDDAAERRSMGLEASKL